MGDEPRPDWLTAAWATDVLGAEVASLWTTRIGDGLVGMNLRVIVEYVDPRATGPRSVVVKLPSPDPTSRATGIALRNYEREVCFYRDVARTVDIRVAACHHAQWSAETGDFVLVLEDLAPGVQGDQVAGCTVQQARTAVLELARLHGPRWDDPSLHELEWLSRRTGADDGAMLAAMWSMVLPGFLATFGPHLSPEATELIEAFGERVAAWVDGRDGPMTVTHGDYRLDNLMFASPDGGYPVAAVDWQTPGHGSPLGDVSYFLGAGLLPPERRRVERRLLDEYAEALTAYGVDVDRDWLWHHYRRDAFAGVVMAVIASQIVGASGRSEAMFAAMATRHAQHALDLDSLALV
jgi:hypothetical protein